MTEDDRGRKPSSSWLWTCSESRTSSSRAAAVSASKNALERPAAHHGSVDDLPFKHIDRLLEHAHGTCSLRKLDPEGCLPSRSRTTSSLSMEIAPAHVSNVRLRGRAPRRPSNADASLHRPSRGAATRRSELPSRQDRGDGAAEDLRVCALEFPVSVSLRGSSGIVRHRITVILELFDGGLELRHGSADIRQLDDVGFGGLDEFAELGEPVGMPLPGRQIVGKTGENPSGKARCPAFRLRYRPGPVNA